MNMEYEYVSDRKIRRCIGSVYRKCVQEVFSVSYGVTSQAYTG